MADQIFAEWAIVEQLGHRRLAGHVTEITIAGAGFLRLDVPEVPGHLASTHLLSPVSVYALHPVGEDVARAVAARCRPEPVQRYELPAAEPDRGLERDLVKLADMISAEHIDHQASMDPACPACIGHTLGVVLNRHGVRFVAEPEAWADLGDCEDLDDEEGNDR